MALPEHSFASHLLIGPCGTYCPLRGVQFCLQLACIEASRVATELGKLAASAEESRAKPKPERTVEQWQRKKGRRELKVKLAEAAGAMRGCAECLLRCAGIKARSPLHESWKLEQNYLFLKRLEKWVCPLCGHEKVERCLKYS